MPEQITNHAKVLDASRCVELIDELVEKQNGSFTYELDLEVIAYGRNYTGKKVGPYASLFVYEPGEAVIRQGEWGGNSFYMLVDGKLDVYIEPSDGSTPRKVNEIQRGRSFGVMSVLAGLPRNATIAVPAEDGGATVLKIDRPALRLLRKLPKFGKALDATYREYGMKRTLEEISQATGGAFSHEMIQKLEQIGEFRVYGKQHTVVREDGLIDRIVFIKNGWVRRSRGAGAVPHMADMMMEVGQDFGVDFLGAGNWLGLEGLRGEERWHYTATVLARTELLEIPIAVLRADRALHDAIYGTFSVFSKADDDVRLAGHDDPRIITAVGKEIDTRLIDGANQHVLAPAVCLHCQDPECLTGCPTGAIGRFPNGQIDIDPKTCIGCGDCATQCPYNAISMVPRQPGTPHTQPFNLRLKDWFSLAPPTLPPEVTDTENLLAVKCNLCNNTPLNPVGARKPAFSCEESCPTGALLRVNPKEYFQGTERAIGLIYRDQTHAIGRNIHKSDYVAKLYHITGIME